MATGPGIPIPVIEPRIASVAASNASLLATDILAGQLQKYSTFRIGLICSISTAASVLFTDGTNTMEGKFEAGGALAASSLYWWSTPALGSGFGINVKLPNNTSSTTLYSLFIDEIRDAVI